MDELEAIKRELEELKAKRAEYELSVNKDTKEKTTRNNKKIENNSTDIRKSVKEELEDIDRQIKEYEQDVKRRAKDYENSYKKLKNIIDDYEEKTEATNLLSAEEIKERREIALKRKLEINEESVRILNELNIEKKLLKHLKTRKTKFENNLLKAEALGLTVDQYYEINAALRKTTIMNAILEKKGLSSIISKKAKERTKEENDKYNEAKEEILREIANIKKADEKSSVLDNIETLYSLEVKVSKSGKPKVISQTAKEIENIEEKDKEFPTRIVSSKIKNTDYIPEEQPKDMEDAKENKTESVSVADFKPAEEKVTVFRIPEAGICYVRRYAANRFKLKSADKSKEIKIRGSVCYEISANDLEKIKENANNSFSPYRVEFVDLKINELEPIKEKTDERDELYNIQVIEDPAYKVYINSINKEQEEKENDGLTNQEIKDVVEESLNKTDTAYIEDIIESNNANKEISKEELNDVVEDGLKDAEVESIIDDMFNVERKPKEKELDKNDIDDIITEDLNEKLEASKLRVNKKFKKELKTGGFFYNIVHKIPTTIKKWIMKSLGKDVIELNDMVEEETQEEENQKRRGK